MVSLAEELSQLANPTPKFHDPEDDIDDTTSARVITTQTSRAEDEDSVEEFSSKFRKLNVPLLSDTDLKYQGKTTSRKSVLEQWDNVSDNSDEDEDTEEREASSLQGDNSTNSEGELDISAFKHQLKLKTSPVKENRTQYQNAGSDDSMEGDDSDDLNDDDDEDDSSGDDDDEIDDDSGVEGDQNDEKDVSEDVTKFSKTDLAEELEKGRAVKHQLSLWDSLLEGRIKLQKALSLTNQLPQSDTWGNFQAEGGEQFTEASHECHSTVKTLLDSLIDLQSLLLLKNSETKHIIQGGEETSQNSEEDEEITSESESEEPTKTQNPSEKISSGILKRKLNEDDYPEFLEKRHMDFKPFRNSTLHKWGEKTRLATGKLKSKSFSAFEQSAVKQIDQIMADQDRLLKRTQLKRSIYKILGKEDATDQGETTNVKKEKETDVTIEADKAHDDEIFDDDDFYHQLLRELIERKTSDISDPVALSRQWLEIQKLRTKVKKKVDTKASKGRKLRYDVHKKLINFMAPVDYGTWTHEARDDLFRSLFGKRFHQKNQGAL